MKILGFKRSYLLVLFRNLSIGILILRMIHFFTVAIWRRWINIEPYGKMKIQYQIHIHMSLLNMMNGMMGGIITLN